MPLSFDNSASRLIIKMTNICLGVLFGFLLIICYNSADGLQCYDCVKCNDPFKKDGVNTTSCSGVCMKTKMTTDGVGISKGDVIRSCLPMSMKSACEEKEQGGYKGEVCTCSGDLCNSADVRRVTITTIIMAAIALLKMFYDML